MTVDPKPTDRRPPWSPETEQAVLGCCLLEPNLIPQVQPEWFYDLRHKTLLEVITAMFNEGVPVDGGTVGQSLLESQQAQKTGGVAYLGILLNACHSPANFEYWVEILREKALLRRIVSVCTELVSAAYEVDPDVDILQQRFESTALELHRLKAGAMVEEGVGQVLPRVIEQIERRWSNPGAIDGLETGFIDLDRLLGGLRAQELIVIGARPGLGKSAISMNIAEHVALDQKQPVGVFSMEMSNEALIQRMLFARAQVNRDLFFDGQATDRDFNKLRTASIFLAQAPIILCDNGGLTISQIHSRARLWMRKYNLKLLILDYLQRVKGDRPSRSRYEHVTEISAKLKDIAKELKIPFLVLAQLSREHEKEERPPRLSDLKESGGIEQDADVIALLYFAKPPADETAHCHVTAQLAKHRDGRTGRVDLMFSKPIIRFFSTSKIEA